MADLKKGDWARGFAGRIGKLTHDPVGGFVSLSDGGEGVWQERAAELLLVPPPVRERGGATDTPGGPYSCACRLPAFDASQWCACTPEPDERSDDKEDLMQEMTEQLDAITGTDAAPEEPTEFDLLNEAGAKFAVFALRHMTGEARRKALAVSNAIADLACELDDTPIPGLLEEALAPALEKIVGMPCGVPGHTVAVPCGASRVAADALHAYRQAHPAPVAQSREDHP